MCIKDRMNGVDAIAFTAGIGENVCIVREKVCAYLGYLGVELNKEANAIRGEEITISTPDSKVKVMVAVSYTHLDVYKRQDTGSIL